MIFLYLLYVLVFVGCDGLIVLFDGLLPEGLVVDVPQLLQLLALAGGEEPSALPQEQHLKPNYII